MDMEHIYFGTMHAGLFSVPLQCHESAVFAILDSHEQLMFIACASRRNMQST
jgi:hypothetical protein